MKLSVPRRSTFVAALWALLALGTLEGFASITFANRTTAAPTRVSSPAQLAFSMLHFGHDGHGNVRYLSDAAGHATDTFDYDAFGSLIAHSGTTPATRLFTGEEFDSDLGLYNLRARYHNSP